MNIVLEKLRHTSKLYKWGLFAVTLFYSFGFAYKANVDWYLYDSQWYYTKADAVFVNGFHILDFPETFRGYFFPVLVGIFKRLFHGNMGWWILASLMVATIFSFVLPFFFYRRHIASAIEAIRGGVAFFVFMWLWKMFMQYPLSDFPAAFFFILAIVLLRSVDDQKKVMLILLIGFLSGVLLYVAYNTRIIYLYSIVLVILVFIVSNIKKRKQLIITMVALALGALVVAMPQCLINKKYTGKCSPKVYSEQLYGYSRSLQAQQLFWGIEWVRFEGYLGDHELYPSDAVIFEDPIGIELLEKESITEGTFTTQSLVHLFAKYPMDMIGIYVRHLISIMTPAYKKIYIENLFVNKWPVVIVSVLIWIVSFMGISASARRKRIQIPDILYTLAICLPGLLQTAGAVEIRFFLPTYLLVYYYVFAVIDYRELWDDCKDQHYRPPVIAAIVFLMWITIFADIMSNNQEMVFLVGA